MESTRKPDLDFWKALHEMLTSAEESIPSGDDPRKVFWDHPDEEWKNDAALADHELELRPAIHDLVVFFCAHRKWPAKSKSAARFLVSRRLLWAKNFAYILTIPSSHLAGAGLQRPDHSGWDVIHWLLTDAYENRFPPSPYTPMYFPPSRDR
jgi:hypothetical protein